MTRFRLLVILCTLGVVGAAAYLLIPSMVPIPEWVKAQWGLTQIGAPTLIEYARNHNGRFPEMELPLSDKGFAVKGVCVEVYSDKHKTGYRFLYFPGRLFNDRLSPEKREIVAASLYGPCKSVQKIFVRPVMYNDGSFELLREDDFQKWLGKGGEK